MIRMTLSPTRLRLILVTLLALAPSCTSFSSVKPGEPPSFTDARGQPKACVSEIRRIEVNQTTLHYFECGVVACYCRPQVGSDNWWRLEIRSELRFRSSARRMSRSAPLE